MVVRDTVLLLMRMKRRVGFRPDNCTGGGGCIDNNGGSENDGRGKDGNDDNNGDDNDHHHCRILSLLLQHQKLVPHSSIYHTNAAMLHVLLRALAMGRLVSEIYPGKGGCGGAIDGSGRVGGGGAEVEAWWATMPRERSSRPC